MAMLEPNDASGIRFLTDEETDALLAAPDGSTWIGRRDRTLLQVAVHTGLRASEIVGLCREDAHLDTDPHLCCHGPEGAYRAIPLTPETVAALSTWLAEGNDTELIFCTRSGGALNPAAVERLIAGHAATAARANPALRITDVSSHTLRHTAARSLLHNGAAPSVVPFLLGYETA
ncbi:tyrosine-type recombinase/integrase [Nocardia sp. NPDC050175]|uniref:tyrosine-type recombinase/integrase n=1 Tax=Nocardia sp. NPDC050175 TaxID=3364317 RepID=UPI0037B45975